MMVELKRFTAEPGHKVCSPSTVECGDVLLDPCLCNAEMSSCGCWFVSNNGPWKSRCFLSPASLELIVTRASCSCGHGTNFHGSSTPRSILWTRQWILSLVGAMAVKAMC
jgi:hypothetical protein